MNIYHIEGALVCTVAHPTALDPAVVRTHVASTYKDAREQHLVYLGMEGFTPSDDVFATMNSSFWLTKLLAERYGYIDDASVTMRHGEDASRTTVTVDLLH